MEKGKKDEGPGPQPGVALILKVSVSSENANQRHSAARWGRAGERRSVELPPQLTRSYLQGPELHPLRPRGEQAEHRTSTALSLLRL